MCNKIINCEWCGVDFKPHEEDVNICPPCVLDMDEMEAKDSQQFFLNMPVNEGFYDLPIEQKRDVLGINYN